MQEQKNRKLRQQRNIACCNTITNTTATKHNKKPNAKREQHKKRLMQQTKITCCNMNKMLLQQQKQKGKCEMQH
jgi:hypothetical protein